MADIVELDDNDIPGAKLNEPLEKHGIPALKWWLQCRGINFTASTKKKDLIIVRHIAFTRI